MATKKKAEEEINLEYGYQQVKEYYNIAITSFKSADEKLNMILVFNAALLATLNFLLPFNTENCVLLTLSYVFLSAFIICLLISIISIIFGLFPRKIPVTDINVFVDATTYHCTNTQYLSKFISTYKESISVLHNKTERKHLCGKIAIIFAVINILFAVVLFFLNNI